MSLTEILAQPEEVTLCSKTIQVRPLSILRLMKIAEDFVIDQRMQNIRRMSELVDAAERSKWLSDQVRELPEGRDLEKLYMPMLNGKAMPNALAIKILHAGMVDDITVDECFSLYNDAEDIETQTAFRIITGKGKSPAQSKSNGSRGKKTGRRK